MTYLIFKAVISGVLIMIVSEVARRSPGIGGLIASLPLVSVIAIIWLWRDTADVERIAAHAESTFWYVLPSLPMFLVFPALLRQGMAFWTALILSCVLTMALYLLTMWLLPKFGIRI
jgi:F0F1-type ATP synthase assembly protein I